MPLFPACWPCYSTQCVSSVLPAVCFTTMKTTSICFPNKHNNIASFVIIRRIRVYCLPRAPLFWLAEALCWHCHHVPLLGSRITVFLCVMVVGGLQISSRSKTESWSVAAVCYCLLNRRRSLYECYRICSSGIDYVRCSRLESNEDKAVDREDERQTAMETSCWGGQGSPTAVALRVRKKHTTWKAFQLSD